MFDINFDEEANILNIRFEGSVEGAAAIHTLILAVHAEIDRIDSQKTMNRLFDLRNLAIPNLDYDIIQSSAIILRELNKPYTSIKIADVVTSDLMYGEHRALAVYAKVPDVERRVFRSEAEARDWLICSTGNAG